MRGFTALSVIHRDLCHIRYGLSVIGIEHPYPLSAWIFHRYLSSDIMSKVKLLL